jgi:SAM-dependent methyltransferase
MGHRPSPRGHLTPDLVAFIHRWLPPGPARVLDVGCGEGELTRRLVDDGYDALGLDPEAPPEPDLTRGALEDFRPDRLFDAAVAIRSLHHLHDPLSALDNLRRLLPPGGRLVAFEFALESVDDAALRWLEAEGLDPPVEESSRDEVIPLAELLDELGRRFRLLAQEPAAYLATEAGREDLAGREAAAISAGILRPAGMRLAYECARLEDSPG